ncbi:MAG: hypothetical protein WC451_06110 [Patescibacteria group bacterium]
MEQTPEIIEVNTLALSVPEQAKQIVKIINNDDYTRAGQILLTIKEIRKKIENTFKPIKQKMDAAKKEVLDQEKLADKPLAEAESYIKPLIAQYNAEQERIRQEEENRLREIARKQEEERRLQEAVAAEQSGNKEEAEAIIEAPVQAPPVVVQKTVPKVQGVSFTKLWKFRITNAALIPREYMIPHEQAIGSVVRNTKGAIQIPGIEIYSEDSVSAGRRAA